MGPTAPNMRVRQIVAGVQTANFPKFYSNFWRVFYIWPICATELDSTFDTGDVLDIHGNIDFDSFPGEDETEQEIVRKPAGTEKRTKTHIEEEKLILKNNLKNPGSAVQKSNDNKRYVYHLYKYPKKSSQHLKMTLTNLMKKIQKCVRK